MARFIEVDKGWLNVEALVFISITKHAETSYTVNCWDSSEMPITFSFKTEKEAKDFVNYLISGGKECPEN